MITRVRDVEGGGYKVTLCDTGGEIDTRETPSLSDAFAWQEYVSVHGELPTVEPVVEEGATE